jgi:hypothetical protein
LVVGLASPSQASGARYWFWPEGWAERTLELSYRQPDNVALREAGEELRTATIIGDPYAIAEAQDKAAAARRGFTVDFATCQGRGPSWRSMFRTFRCKLSMSSASNVKTVFVTVNVVGRTSYRINKSGKVWNR